MGGHTFGFPEDRTVQSLPISASANGNGSAARPAGKSRMPWNRRDPSAGRQQGGLKWKIAAAGVTIIFLQVLGANVLFPLFTHHTIGSAQITDTNGAASLLGSSVRTTTPGSDSSSTDSSGGIIRLLTETASAWTNDLSLTKEQQDLLQKYGDQNFRGQDIWMKRDGLTNPFVMPPASVAAAGDPGNVQRYTARTLNALYREKCGNTTILPYNGGSGREWVTTSRAWAKAFGGEVSKYRWCRGGSNVEVPELKQVLMLRSTKPRPARAVTVVTQLSLERASMLEQQCSLWPHPVAAVVYIPLLRGRIFSAEEGPWNMAPLEQGIEEMKALHQRLSALPEGCVLDLEVVAEECCNQDIASMYPTNAVRNRALQLASTEVVLLLDADFVVDLSLAKTLEDKGKYKEMVDLLSNHRALVLPAFEAWDQGDWGMKVALEAVHQGKAYIAAKFMYNVVIGFHMSHYPQGHEKTNFWRWMNTTEPYEVQYEIGFEPYIMLLKKFVPYYDERFRGYYWNKVQHLMHISMQDSFTFVIHPEAFVVHVPHRKPSTKMRTRRSGQKERNHVMFLEALEDMKRERFVPVTGFPHLCLPPVMQRAAAAVVANEEQKATLLKMATVVRKLREEELPGGGAEALVLAQGKTFDSNAANAAAFTVTNAEGELPAKVKRPQIPGTAEAKARAKQAQQVRDAQELEQDLQELVEFNAARRAGGSKSSARQREEEEEENEAAEQAAIAEAQEKAAFVEKLIAKEAKKKSAAAARNSGRAGGNKKAATADLFPDEIIIADDDDEEDNGKEEEEQAMEMELADAEDGSFEIEEQQPAGVVEEKPASKGGSQGKSKQRDAMQTTNKGGRRGRASQKQ
jgi:glycosyltransferase-like protein LARGE